MTKKKHREGMDTGNRTKDKRKKNEKRFVIFDDFNLWSKFMYKS